MQIAVDAMGGDHAPRAVIEGAFQAAASGIEIVLVGDRAQLEPELERCGATPRALRVEHAEEVVTMEDRAVAVRKKRRSSIRVCTRLVKEGKAQAVVSAGNTGAAMIAAKTVIGSIPGVDRPALAAVFPVRGGRTVVLDVGANVSASAAHLRQFAVMGHFYAQGVLGTSAPRIGLMSVGEEEGKGTSLAREAFQVLKRTGLNFIGNVEGGDVFSGEVDVIVCDGFVGNVLLKSGESLAGYLGTLMRESLQSSWRTRLGYLLAKPAFDEYRRRTHWSEYGAVPLLGVRAGCFIAHGRSNARAIRNAIQRAVEFCEARVHEKIETKVAELHDQEASILAGGDGA
ncbi:MAG: phosphate acyltransferase PlsX [Acidobacteriota bacterium]